VKSGANLRNWPIASFRCDAEFGRGKADIDQAAPGEKEKIDWPADV
jgi:hypothetical protein